MHPHNTKLFRFRRTALAASLGLSIGLFSVTAFAQDAQSDQAPSQTKAKELSAVTVTGSRIHSVDVETAQPVFTVTQADIQKTGLVSVGDILANLTVAGSQTFSKAGVLTSNPEQGGQYINIRNLGEQRTLVLVNGKRWATSLAGFTDLSTIPSALIERIDILKDGASSLYGSDAIAGVVNIILKDRYEGAEASAYYGQNQQGDGTKDAYSFTLGGGNDKASLVFGANYTKEGAVWAKKRNATSYTYGPNHAEDGLSGTSPWGYYQLLNATGGGTGPRHVINHTGTWNGVGVGADSRDPANYHTGQTIDDLYNPTQQMQMAGPNELKSIFTTGRYDINQYVTFRATGMYAERDNTRQVAGYPLNSLTQATNPVYLSGGSYYNPLGQDLYFARRITELPRVTKNNVKSYHFDAGFEGYFEVGSRTWNWDVGTNYNKYDVVEYGSGNLNLLNLKQALGPSFLNSAGQVQCGTAANPIAFSSCVPFDILGGPSASTPEALKYINSLSQATLQSISKEYTANITGGLFDLPAGEVGFAAGYEHRKVSGFAIPDQLASSGKTTDLAAGATYGNYTINEGYVELNVPLLKDLPGAKLLSIDVASRYSHYSNFGSTTNNKYSFQWKPISDLLVRGTYAEGFRAPTLDDVSGGGSQTFDYYTDPCDTRFGAAATDAGVAAKCAAQGLPANFRQIGTTGLPVTARDQQGTTAFNSGVGNADLTPEKSVSKTAGIVYSPQWVPGLDLNADWYNIKITNVITSISANYVLNQCYLANSTTFCSQFGRDPGTGQVVGLNRGNINTGMLSTEGWDFGAHYRLPEFGYGKFGVNFDANYLSAYNTQSSSDADVVGYAGTWSLPRWRINAGVDWSMGDFGASWGLRYYGAFRDQCWEADVECNQPNYEGKNWGTGANRKGAIVFHDVQFRYDTPWNANVQVGVNNVFNKKRPITYTVTNSSASYYDPALDIDRYFYVRYIQKF
ncbi:MAG: TonB-dependent receptor [Rhodanobacter sp. 68-29]|nr:TonB-dependent receptor [Rhodanobacter sp.]ODU75897.1 MAG: TonB-dependent receptor [Rhodanobacter sp. SCN 69-32]OJY62112.1 MAG: TonB-dependent receptor [Rhodanobacter sp. 68-29]